ncbi:MAG: patatin-like phospholipase family protein [Bacteroidota bacterium]
MSRALTNIWYSFPVQLLLVHLKYHVILSAIWLFIGSLMTGTFANLYGFKYLFWSPEYLGKVDFWSFFFLGVGFASFAMTWNLTTYLLAAHRFPFLACLARPFTKYSINNFILPLFFILLILFLHIRFEIQEERFSYETTIYNCLGFSFGLITLVLLLIAYFIYTNKNIFAFTKDDPSMPPNLIRSIGPGRGIRVEDIKHERRTRRVDYYLTESFVPRRVRSVAHYSLRTLQRVFKQNHANALAVQMTSLFVLIALGLLIDRPSFQIPAGASLFLLFSMIVTIAGAIIYWFHQWSLTVFVGLFICINMLTKQGFFNHENKAYGLDYKQEEPTYDYLSLQNAFADSIKQKDIENTIQILENWKRKTGQTRPKMLMLAVSGGGLKATTWTMQVLRTADSLSNGKLMQHTALMSGASGGMMGMAFYRELYWRQQRGKATNPYNEAYIKDVSKDLLNPVAFTIVANDIFMPKGTFKVGGKRYTKDRGYIFERQFNANTHHYLEKTLGDYQQAEFNAEIPMMVLTPYIVNDARRLIISPQPMSYLTAPISPKQDVDIDAVDFQNFFKDQHPDSLRFLSALRMNATYPYILPNVTLPTRPDIEVMDAGYRDNFGLETSARFISVFQDWIHEHTSGVVILSVRVIDRKSQKIEASDQDGILKSILDPLGIAGKIIQLQDYEHDMHISFLHQLLGKDRFEVLQFIYEPTTRNEEASMTFHLTPREREDILSAVDSERNKQNFRRVLELLGH